MDTEELICRVCRSPGTDDNQLYHPCKCSGSMRYVHQECLEDWLTHSRKKHCEICNFKYNFTPIYNQNTPSSISLNFFTSILLKKALVNFKFYLRVLLAVSIWLIALPYASITMWRFWFEPTILFDSAAGKPGIVSVLSSNGTLDIVFNGTSGESPIMNLTSTHPPHAMEASGLVLGPILNFTVAYLQHVARFVGLNETVWDLFEGAFPLWDEQVEVVLGEVVEEAAVAIDWGAVLRKFFTDVFEGQILLSFLIILAIALLCIKEYIVLNTPLDALGNPVHLPEDQLAEFLNNPNNFVAAPVAPPPRQARRAAQRRQVPRPPPPPMAPRLAAPAPPPPVRRPRPIPPPGTPLPAPLPHPSAPLPTANPLQPNLDMHTLQTHHQRVFEHALESGTHEAIDLAMQEASSPRDQAVVASAARLALSSFRDREQAILNNYRIESIDAVRDLLEFTTPLDEGERTRVSDVFTRAVRGMTRGEDVREAVESTMKEIKTFKKRLGGPLEEKVERLVDRLESLTHANVDEEREEEEEMNSPPGQALNTMRSVEEDQEVIRELGMYMSMKEGSGDVIRRAVIPIREGGGAGSSSSSGGPSGVGLMEGASVDFTAGRPLEANADPEFEALVREFEEYSSSLKGKQRVMNAKAMGEDGVESHKASVSVLQRVEDLERSVKGKQRVMDVVEVSGESHKASAATTVAAASPASHRYALRSRKTSPDAADTTAPIQPTAFPLFGASPAADTVPQQPPRLPTFEFEAPIHFNPLAPPEPPLPPPQELPAPAAPLPAPQPPAAPRRRRPPAPLPQQDPLPNDPAAFNLNVNIDLGPDGVLAAQVQAQGDLHAFLELIGVQGPMDLLLQNFALALFIVFAALGAGVWVPWMVGRGVVWLLVDVYWESVKGFVGPLMGEVEKGVDVVLDPVVDVVVVLVGLFGVGKVGRLGNGTVVEVAMNGTVVEAIDVSGEKGGEGVLSPELQKVLEGGGVHGGVIANATVEGGDEIVANATVEGWEAVTVSIGVTGNASDVVEAGVGGKVPVEKKEKQPQRFEFVSDRGLAILVGYATFAFVLYHHARRSGHLNHPYVHTLRRMVQKGFRFLLLAVKFSFFIAIELGMFPTFCGFLIDISTLTVFGPNTTLTSRLAFYNAYPWTSYFLHWLAGTTFMFQFAGYVQSVRKFVRPGLVWFIRDPEDPQFHPMQDILEKPILTQLKKLAFGAMMYAIVVISTIGGYVTLIHVIQNVLGATEGAARFWPVKWEFSEPMSEFPIDLLIFHFLVPAVVSWVRPKEVVVRVLRGYFRFAARRLRVTQFLFGERVVAEELGEVPEVEGEVVRKVFEEVAVEEEDGLVDMVAGEVGSEEGSEWSGGSGDEADGEAEEVGAPDVLDAVQAPVVPPPVAAPQPATLRATPYLRVPNHDRIPLKPGQKVMIPMRVDEPLVGRAGETEEDIRLNWTRVYVPENLRIRLVVLMFFQWLGGISLAAVMTMGPLYVGRVFFVALHTFFTNQPLTSLPVSDSDESTSPLLNATTPSSRFSLLRFRFLPATNASLTDKSTGRHDLPVHDLFSLAFGLLVCIGVAVCVQWGYRMGSVVVARFRRAVNEEAPVGSARERVGKVLVEGVKWCFANVVVYSKIIGKVSFVAFWVCIALPTLFGLLFEIYVVVPFMGDKPQTRVFFILQDWALGAIYTKVVHSIIMNAPDNELRRVLIQARDQFRQGGIERFELRPVALKVLFPLVLMSVGLVFLPAFVLLSMEYLEGDGEIAEPGTEWNTLLTRLLVPALLFGFFGFELIRSTRRTVKQWMDQVRDEHYLVGRRLRNMGDPPAVVPEPVVAAGVAPVVGGGEGREEEEEEVPLLEDVEDDDWVDDMVEI
ncbi:hypothetical protein HDU98_000090 [Podochytrium sp. JEL0797]|nr:hypothetical protein HDU98_000090 [Podochytrium sp. JEL0797]